MCSSLFVPCTNAQPRADDGDDDGDDDDDDVERLQCPSLRKFKTPSPQTAAMQQKPATMGPTSNTLTTNPATYFLFETGPLSRASLE